MTLLSHLPARLRINHVMPVLFVVAVAWDVVRVWGSPTWSNAYELVVIATFAVAIIVGELFVISLPGSRASAPISAAAGLAFAMVPSVLGQQMRFGGDVVFVVSVASMAIGAAIVASRGRTVHLEELMMRAYTVGWAALLARDVRVSGRSLVQWDASRALESQRWLVALAMTLIAVSGFLLYVAGATLLVAAREHLPVAPVFLDEFRAASGLSAALSATGALVALAADAVGLLAIPLYLSPLLLTQFAVRRQAGIRETYAQTIRTLARMTEVAGYTAVDHGARVAALGRAVGRELGMREREARDLEVAGLLHDIGQLALFEAIPAGATVMAAPADQRQIALDGAAIVRTAGTLDTVALIIESQTHQFRQVREFGEELPLASRILKVVNAFDDLTAGSADPAIVDAALERISLGLGYEYDPAVVDALISVLTRGRVSSRGTLD